MATSQGSPAAAALAERRARIEGYGALLVVQLFFGLFPVFGKWAMAAFSPRAVAGWRICFGALCLGLVAFLLHGREAFPKRGSWGRFCACALLGVTLNMVLFLEGLERSTAVNAGLIIQVIPVFTFAIAVILRREIFVASRGLGILVAFAGTMWLALAKGPDLSEQYVLGNLLIILNCFCYSLYLVLARPLLAQHPPLVVIAWVFILSAWAVPVLAVGEDWWPAQADTRAWTSLGYAVIFPTVLAYLLNAYALARVSSSTTAVFIFLQAFITGAAAIVLLGESLAPRTVMSATLIFLGVWLVLRRPVARPVAATSG